MEKIDPQKLAQAISDKFTKPITSVYIDLPYLQDIYLGGLLLSHLNERDYNYIFSQLEKYKKRHKLEHASYFPDLKMTEEELIAFMTSKEKVTSILVASPMTSLYMNMVKLHTDILEHNQMVSSDGNGYEVTYLINTYPLNLTTDQMVLLKEKFSHLNGKIKFGIIQKPLHELKSKLFQDTSVWFIYDLSPMTNDTCECGRECLLNFTFRDSLVHSPQRIGNPNILESLEIMPESEIKNIFIDTASLMNIYTNFYYLDIDIKTTTEDPSTS